MKYLLLLSLFCSTLVFAEQIDTRLLIGKWQCNAQYQDTELTSREKSTLEYYSDGTYKTKSKMNYHYQGQTDTVKVVLKGKWKVQGDSYYYTVDKVLHFSAKNKQLAKELGLEQFLKTDDEFIEEKITELSEQTLSFIMTDKDMELLQATARSDCQRINKK